MAFSEAIEQDLINLVTCSQITSLEEENGVFYREHSRILIIKNPKYYGNEWARIIHALINLAWPYYGNFVIDVLGTMRGDVRGLLLDLPFIFYNFPWSFRKIFGPLYNQLIISARDLKLDTRRPFGKFIGPAMFDGISECVINMGTIFKIPKTRFVITSTMGNKMTWEDGIKIERNLPKYYMYRSYLWNGMIRSLKGNEGFVVDLPIFAREETIRGVFMKLTERMGWQIEKVSILDEDDIRLLEKNNLIDFNLAQEC